MPRSDAFVVISRIARKSMQTLTTSSIRMPPKTETDLRSDIVSGLTSPLKRIPPKYLYDDLGSSLFDTICRLPWYTITRSELALLKRESSSITKHLGSNPSIVELGGGSGEKLAVLVRSLAATGVPVRTDLVDISGSALETAKRTLSQYQGVSIFCHESSYVEGLRAAVEHFDEDEPAMVVFLGSNIGNLAPDEVDQFLRDVRNCLRANDHFLVGVDLVKPENDLVQAYNDPLGVTAAFNRNLLVRLNRELDADFCLDQFNYHAAWNSSQSRVEMYLVSQTEQTVCLTGIGTCVRLLAGEAILTESSYKYRRRDIQAIGEKAGFVCVDQWIEDEARFSLTLFGVQ